MIVDLNLIGKRVLVVGGGTEAVRKVEGLLTQDCEIIVITDQVADEIRSWANAEKLKLEEELVNDGAFLKRFEPLFLVMAATDDKELNRSIVKSADAMRCYAYTVDDTEYSDFSCPAVVNLHDTVQIAISTGGKSPMMAKQIRQKAFPILSDIIKKEDALKIQLQGRVRKKVQAKIDTFGRRKDFLQWMLEDEEINNLLNKGLLDDAETLALQNLEKH
ncbi:MAG: precorrin-2 dehydrogenase/sirohydrochlorin ferrochelatase family protein [Nitrospinales bacterium]